MHLSRGTYSSGSPCAVRHLFACMIEESPVEYELPRQTTLGDMRGEWLPDLASESASVPFVAPLEAMRQRQLRRSGLFERWNRGVVMNERVQVGNRPLQGHLAQSIQNERSRQGHLGKAAALKANAAREPSPQIDAGVARDSSHLRGTSRP